MHPPLVDAEYFAQPRAVTLAPNGNLIVVCNDSGFVFQVDNAKPSASPTDLRLTMRVPGGAQLRWTGVLGSAYRVERAFDLAAGDWQPVGATWAGSGDANTVFTDPDSTVRARCFYRVLPSL
jgi:hypothetical protein